MIKPFSKIKILISCRVVPVRFYKMDLSDLRVPYLENENSFLEKDIETKEPFSLFTKWFEEAKNNSAIKEPNAMCLATATKDGIPSARIVLCKGFDKKGFKFFTHYTSRKGLELNENPNAALTFYWEALSKCVRIEGMVEKLSQSEADIYFSKRPYRSQIGALCSDQSKPIGSRDQLLEVARKLRETYSEGNVPRPKFWGGYRLIPKSIEFWVGQTDRIHDRIKFKRSGEGEVADDKFCFQGEEGWLYERLQP